MTRSIYVVSCEPRSVKIGMALNIKKRLFAIRTHCPFPATLAFAGKCNEIEAGKIERRAHAILSKFRTQGEWFAISVDDAIAAVMQAANDLGYEIVPQTIELSPRRPRDRGKLIPLAITEEMNATIADWRQKQDDVPNRSEAIRRLLARQLAAEASMPRRVKAQRKSA